MTQPPSVAFVGPGVVGTTLARLLHRSGFRISALIGRRIEAAEAAARDLGGARAGTRLSELRGADWIFITTPDRTIQSVCRSLVDEDLLGGRPIVAHCSGALDAQASLAGAREIGCPIASFHPLLSFADPDHAEAHFAGTTCVIEGDAVAVEALRFAAEKLGARPLVLRPGGKRLYHAGAAIASNNLVSGTALAVELFGLAGVGAEDALLALLPLLRSTLDNLEDVGLPRALTGPIARGDYEIVEGHLKALHEAAPHRLEPYRSLSRLTLELAERKGGLSEEEARRLRELLASKEDEECC
ncbi:MAG: DUF2520 domain-containing protein [Planctomycetota bacterium]